MRIGGIEADIDRINLQSHGLCGLHDDLRGRGVEIAKLGRLISDQQPVSALRPGTVFKQIARAALGRHVCHCRMCPPANLSEITAMRRNLAFESVNGRH